MTWSRFDDAARTHPKAVKAGNEAWGFWAAAVMYCNQYGTDGVIGESALTTILPVPISRRRARLLAERLCDVGLFYTATKSDGNSEQTAQKSAGNSEQIPQKSEEICYVIHDFLEWNPSKLEREEQRARDRCRKGTSRESTAAARSSARNPEGILEESADGVRTESKRSRARVLPSRPVPSRSDPKDSTATHDLTGSAREPAGAAAVAVAEEPASPESPTATSSERAQATAAQSEPRQSRSDALRDLRVPCPPTLQLSRETLDGLEMARGIPEWAAMAMVSEYALKYSATPSELRTLDQWMRGAVTTACSRWSDPSTRPKKPNDPDEESKAEKAKRDEAYQRSLKEDAERLEGGVPCPPELLAKMAAAVGRPMPSAGRGGLYPALRRQPPATAPGQGPAKGAA